MYKIIPTDKLEANLLRTFGGRSVSIQPNAAWEDEPFVQEINEHKGVKEYLDGLVKDGLITFVKDKVEEKPAERTVDEYTKRELIQFANENFEAGWDEEEYMKEKRDKLLELVQGLEVQAGKDD